MLVKNTMSIWINAGLVESLHLQLAHGLLRRGHKLAAVDQVPNGLQMGVNVHILLHHRHTLAH